MTTLHDTSDSFKLLLNQLRGDISTTFSNIKDILAILGAIYASKKLFDATRALLDAVNSHVLSRVSDSGIQWQQEFGPWAVITGSSEGVGKAYALELAMRGINVVIISRNESKLKQVKQEIESECGVQVDYIVADFAAENQTALYKHISEQLEGKEIGLLVNNVGVMYDYPEVLLNISRQKLWQLIYVNIGAATMMSHLVLPQMVKRGRGGLVVVSSGSSTQITPQMTVYSATKRYLDYFIQGLAYEYRHSGVTFQCLIPFYLATRMTGYSDRLHKGSIVIPDAAHYARSAISTLGRTSRTTGYFPHTLQLWLGNLIPMGLWMWGADKLNNSLRREALARLARRPPKSASKESLAELKP